MFKKLKSLRLPLALITLFVILPVALIRGLQYCDAEQKAIERKQDSLIELKLKLEIQALKKELNK